MLLPPDGDLGDADSAHSLDDSLALCLDTGNAPLAIANTSAASIPLPLIERFERATALQQISVP